MGAMTHSDPLEPLRRALRATRDDGAPRPDCPDDEALAALAAGELAGEARRDVITHVASCGACRAAVASLARAFADPAVAGARSQAVGARRPGLGRLALPAAAAAVLLVAVLTRPSGNTQDPVHRAPEASTVAGPRPISPVGAIGRTDRLHWGAVAGADRYRVTLYQSDGRTLYHLELPDTMALLPDSVPLTVSETYRWKVEARTGWDRWTTSELAHFTFTEEPAP
jgi:hypothetical protein